MGLLIFYVALALGVSFLCSMLEAVLLSITPSYLALMAERHPGLGARLKQLKKDIDRPLSAILTLNTAAHTIGAVGAGAQAAKVFGDAWVGVLSAVLTLLILFVSEIIPKTLGALYWRRLAPGLAFVLPPIIILTWPLVMISVQITRLMTRRRFADDVSRAELRAFAELAARRGLVPEDQSRILTNLFRLNQLRVVEITTPRTAVKRVAAAKPIGELYKNKEAMQFSRLPIYREEPDEIVGYVLKADILREAAHDRFNKPVEDLAHELLTVPESISVGRLLEQMAERSEHMALVVDEYGDVTGIVTLEDVFEALLGTEILDESDTVTNIREHARRRARERSAQARLSDAE